MSAPFSSWSAWPSVSFPTMTDARIGERLEMLLVLQWLDEGTSDDGAVRLSVATAAAELDLGPDREGLLALMAALGELEARGTVAVAWPGRPAAQEALVTLAPDLRRDARRLFGRTSS